MTNETAQNCFGTVQDRTEMLNLHVLKSMLTQKLNDATFSSGSTMPLKCLILSEMKFTEKQAIAVITA